MGQLGWWLRIRRGLVLANLAQALPALPREELARIGARAARSFGRTVTEFIRFGGHDRARVGSLVRFEGLPPLREALAGGGGAIVVTAHLGSWALYVTALAAAGIPAALLVGKQHNELVDRFILALPGGAVRLVSKGPSSPREVLRCLKEGRAVVMVADQYVWPYGEMVPFMGRITSTLPLPGAITARHGTPLFVAAGHRVADGTHLVTVALLPVPSEGEEADRRREITVTFNDALAAAIRAFPNQYFWYHRRWRDEEALALRRKRR